jgi:mono/diheme cytochrome c family protein
MPTKMTSRHSHLSDKDSRALISVFSAYISASLWLLFASSLGATEPGGFDAAKGAALYTANCSACHQAGGGGLPGVFPSLKDDAVVNKDDATKHIDVVLNGMHDARVSGVVYSSPMPAFAATLSDTEIADLIDFERTSWGNHGKPIAAAQVGTERAKAK